jgi:hypothetical protein
MQDPDRTLEARAWTNELFPRQLTLERPRRLLGNREMVADHQGSKRQTRIIVVIVS